MTDLQTLFDLANKIGVVSLLLVTTIVLWRVYQKCLSDEQAAKKAEPPPPIEVKIDPPK